MSRETQKTGIYAVTIILAVIISGLILTTHIGLNTIPFIILVSSLVIIYSLIRGAASAMVTTSPTHLFAAKARDPSSIQRLVLDTNIGKEYIISGSPSQSFRSACKNDWAFQSMKANDVWIIKDERGNDISETSLSEYDGIATLVSTKPPKSSSSYYESSNKDADKSDDYSDIERGVTFYD